MFATLVCLGSTSRCWHCCPYTIRWQRASLSFAAQQVQRRASATYRLEQHFCAAAAIRCDEERDTIAALSSGSGRCGVALLRVSGPRAGQTPDPTSGLSVGWPKRLKRLSLCRSSTAEPITSYTTSARTKTSGELRLFSQLPESACKTHFFLCTR